MSTISSRRSVIALAVVAVCATLFAQRAFADDLLNRAQAAFTEHRWEDAAP